MSEQAVQFAAPTAVAAFLSAVGLPLMMRFGALKRNFRGEATPSPAGFIYAGAALAGVAVFSPGLGRDEAVTWAVTAGAFFALGLVDDLFGSRARGGFRGHFREAIKGRITTAQLKALGGGLVAVWASWRLLAPELGPVQPGSYLGWSARAALGALVVVLSANATNLLDLRPGRAAKAVFVCLVLFSLARPVPWTLSLLGPVAVAGWLDVRGRLMMGDSGSNLLGCLVGLTCLASLPLWGLATAFALLVWINLYSEWRSITQLIETIPILRTLDRLGRRF